MNTHIHSEKKKAETLREREPKKIQKVAAQVILQQGKSPGDCCWEKLYVCELRQPRVCPAVSTKFLYERVQGFFSSSFSFCFVFSFWILDHWNYSLFCLRIISIWKKLSFLLLAESQMRRSILLPFPEANLHTMSWKPFFSVVAQTIPHMHLCCLLLVQPSELCPITMKSINIINILPHVFVNMQHRFRRGRLELI